MLQGRAARLPVTQDNPFSLRGSDGELEWSVEIMLLFIRSVHDFAAPDHEEARVTQVRCVQAVATSVQYHNAGCAATYKQNGHPLTVSPGLLPIITQLQGAACLHKTTLFCPTPKNYGNSLSRVDVLRTMGVAKWATEPHTLPPSFLPPSKAPSKAGYCVLILNYWNKGTAPNTILYLVRGARLH